MAVTQTVIIDGGRAHWKLSNGPVLAIVDITMSATAIDYVVGAGGGLTLDAAAVGMKQIYAIIPIGLRAAGGALRMYPGVFDAITKNIQFIEAPGNAVSAATEIENTSGGDVTNGDIVRAIVIGE